MDLVAVFSSLRRHKIIVLMVLLLTIGGDLFVVYGLPQQYESKAQYLLSPPPPAPTDEEIQKNPSLAKLNANNPYLRVATLSVVTDVLAQRVGADETRKQLIAQGADQDYAIATTNAIGSGQLIEITGTGHSPEESDRTRDLVVAQMVAQLHDMQTVNGADDRYLIKAIPVTQSAEPLHKVTVTMRSVIAVTVAGLILLFALISIADAIAPWRRRRAGLDVPHAPEPPRQLEQRPTGTAGVPAYNGTTYNGTAVNGGYNGSAAPGTPSMPAIPDVEKTMPVLLEWRQPPGQEDDSTIILPLSKVREN